MPQSRRRRGGSRVLECAGIRDARTGVENAHLSVECSGLHAALRRAARNDGWLGMNYDLDEIEKNHEAFANQGEVTASSAVRRMLKGERQIFGITAPSFAQG